MKDLAPRGSPWEARPLLGNVHLQVRIWRSDEPMDHLVRNADGDDSVLHEGSASLDRDYGHLRLGEGDYLMLPRGTLWRLELEHQKPLTALLIEATNDSYRLPDKGIVGSHAVFDPAMLDIRIDLCSAPKHRMARGGSWSSAAGC